MLNIKVVEKVNPRDLTAPRKFYGSVKLTETITLRELSKQISKETTLGIPDVLAVIEALLQDIPEHLIKGKKVKLNEFGTFRLTVTGQGSDTAEEYSTALIDKPNLNFWPGVEFRNVLNSAVYHKITPNIE